MRIDCHVHTNYSPDGTLSLANVLRVARQKHLDGLAVTDHNTITGALALKAMAPAGFTVIVSEEIHTAEGEIIGFFLTQPISAGLSPEETINRIKAQGGLVGVPHPFCRLRKSRLSFEALKRIAGQVDIIEGFNARNLFSADNDEARRFAQLHNKVITAGSDAHTRSEYGAACVEIEPFTSAQEFKHNLSSAHLIRRTSPLWVHLFAKASRFLR
ncbi:MAG: PHP domain-containing protein [Candidatus Brocadiia bacterium]